VDCFCDPLENRATGAFLGPAVVAVLKLVSGLLSGKGPTLAAINPSSVDQGPFCPGNMNRMALGYVPTTAFVALRPRRWVQNGEMAGDSPKQTHQQEHDQHDDQWTGVTVA
jgi:hypothetical protein